jgi:hypothetical protein
MVFAVMPAADATADPARLRASGEKGKRKKE